MLAERAARLFVAGVVLGVVLGLLLPRWLAQARSRVVEVHARVAGAGGFLPGDLTAVAGEPLPLRLVSDDVLHGFAIGQSDRPALELLPGQAVTTTLVFDQPGTYVFYCTRWCGLDHWRMRGTIEVKAASGAEVTSAPAAPPLYVALGIDLDAPHTLDAAAPGVPPPAGRPSAVRGAALVAALPAPLAANYVDGAAYRGRIPASTWLALRAEPGLSGLSDAEVWDVAAFAIRAGQRAAGTTSEALSTAREQFAANCAACHGEAGAGDGVMAALLAAGEPSAGTGSATPGHAGEHTVRPINFTDPMQMLGSSPALLQGKIIRGGMGTGMPYWGPILTEAQSWALADFLWTFQFDGMEEP